MGNQEKIFLQIKNFRSLEEVEIELRPNIFLFGTNGSGKSSLIKSIIFLSNYINNVMDYHIGVTDPYIYMVKSALSLNKFAIFNSFKDIVTNNEIDRKVLYTLTLLNNKVDCRITNKLSAYITDTTKDLRETFVKVYKSSKLKSRKEQLNHKIRFVFADNAKEFYLLERITIADLNGEFTFSFKPLMGSDDNQYPHFVPEVKFKLGNARNLFMKNFLEQDLYIEPAFKKFNFKSKGKDQIEAEIFRKVIYYFRDKEVRKDNEYYNGLTGIEKNNLFNELMIICDKFFIHIPQRIVTIFSNLMHVPSIREVPKNSYPLSGNRFLDDDYFGIPKRLDDDIYHKTLKDEINEVLTNHFYLDEKIDIDKETLSGCLVTKNIKNGAKSNLSNSSSGMQQLLPIIYFLLDERSQSMFLCEQPELHLHPRVQALLASFLVENNEWSKVKIIETHSEHIIRKLQVLIAQGKLTRDDIGVYYFDKDAQTGVTSIKEMEIDDNGLFHKKWPDGFFDQKLELTLELLDAIRNRSN
jgi:predicted ATP-dependent endonuclease of OLD family